MLTNRTHCGCQRMWLPTLVAVLAGVSVSAAFGGPVSPAKGPATLALPADLATVLNERELVDLVAWLGTLRAGQ